MAETGTWNARVAVEAKLLAVSSEYGLLRLYGWCMVEENAGVDGGIYIYDGCRGSPYFSYLLDTWISAQHDYSGLDALYLSWNSWVLYGMCDEAAVHGRQGTGY